MISVEWRPIDNLSFDNDIDLLVVGSQQPPKLSWQTRHMPRSIWNGGEFRKKCPHERHTPTINKNEQNKTLKWLALIFTSTVKSDLLRQWQNSPEYWCSEVNFLTKLSLWLMSAHLHISVRQKSFCRGEQVTLKRLKASRWSVFGDLNIFFSTWDQMQASSRSHIWQKSFLEVVFRRRTLSSSGHRMRHNRFANTISLGTLKG